VIAAIGCLQSDYINNAAADIYGAGHHINDDFGLRIRLIAIGRDLSADLTKQHPKVLQLTWPDMLGFIWGRFYTYRQQKTQVDQWNGAGKKIKTLADQSHEKEVFVNEALRRMGVRNVVDSTV
jgi:hypothetical protein